MPSTYRVLISGSDDDVNGDDNGGDDDGDDGNDGDDDGGDGDDGDDEKENGDDDDLPTLITVKLYFWMTMAV